MNNQTSILTDIELDAVNGGSFWGAVVAGVLQGATNASTGVWTAPPPSNFGVGQTTSTGGGGGRCNANHNGVHYNPM
jgi:hypothetical protein